MAIWDNVLTERDKQVFGAAGYGRRQGFGHRPAVIVVDVNYNFVGDVPNRSWTRSKNTAIAVERKVGRVWCRSAGCWRLLGPRACRSSIARRQPGKPP